MAQRGRFNNNRYHNSRGGNQSRGQPMNNNTGFGYNNSQGNPQGSNSFGNSSRGGNQHRGQSLNNHAGFQFNGSQGNPQGSNSYRPRVNKPQMCSFFQQGTCTNPGCQNLHQYSFNNEIGRLQQLNANTPIFAACLITDSQVSVSIAGKIQIYDIKTSAIIAEFPINGRTKQILYTSEFEPGFLLFCGDNRGQQLIGAISLNGAIGNFNPAHAAGVSCMMVRRGLIFAGGDDAKVSVWYYTGQNFELGMLMEMEPSLQSQVNCITLVQNFVIAGLISGLVIGWEYNFENNQYV